MIAWINAITSNFSTTLWNITWQVGLLIVLIDLCALLGKRASAFFRYGLWVLVLIRLCLPFPIAAPFSLNPVLKKPVEELAARIPLRLVMNANTPSLTLESYLNNYTNIKQWDVPQIPPRTIEVTPVPWYRQFSPSSVLFLFWLAGVLGFTGLILYQYWKVRRTLADCPPVHEPAIRALVDEIRLGLGIRAPVVCKCIPASLPSSGPRIGGLRHPVIYLPEPMLQQWEPEEMRPVLTHELAHIRNYDLWVNWLQIGLQVVYFFHPFVWYANARIRQAREEVADAIAIRTLNGKNGGYSRSILRVIEENQGRSPRLVEIGFTENKKTLKSRLTSIMRIKDPAKVRLGYSTLIGLVLVALITTVFATQKPSPVDTTITAPEVTASTTNRAASSLESLPIVDVPIKFVENLQTRKPVAGVEVFVSLGRIEPAAIRGPFITDAEGQCTVPVLSADPTAQARPNILLAVTKEKKFSYLHRMDSQYIAMMIDKKEHQGKFLFPEGTDSSTVEVSIQEVISTFSMYESHADDRNEPQGWQMLKDRLTVRSNKTGTFQLAHLLSFDPTNLLIKAPGYATIQKERFHPIPENETPTLEIAMIPETVIEGSIAFKDTQESVAGKTVTLVPQGGQTYGTIHQSVTDEHGGFRFDRLEPGRYLARVTSNQLPLGWICQPVLIDTQREAANPITVEIPLKKGILVSGRVVTEETACESPTMVPPVRINSNQRIGGRYTPGSETWSDWHGHYQIALPEGPNWLRVISLTTPNGRFFDPNLRNGTRLDIKPGVKEIDNFNFLLVKDNR
ncbi:MAG: M56 family metallopeptidase [bacterium]|jgi:beta-lactamase regulating signal transducer with metallopeptidase domain|nr:M56 family metallopeptidase [bacterium]